MFLIQSEKDLLECFRPLDQSKVELPKDMKYPLFVRDYLRWLEPSGARVYLVFASPGTHKRHRVSTGSVGSQGGSLEDVRLVPRNGRFG
jgi:hypothetical protein